MTHTMRDGFSLKPDDEARQFWTETVKLLRAEIYGRLAVSKVTVQPLSHESLKDIAHAALSLRRIEDAMKPAVDQVTAFDSMRLEDLVAADNAVSVPPAGCGGRIGTNDVCGWQAGDRTESYVPYCPACVKRLGLKTGPRERIPHVNEPAGARSA